MDKMHNTHRLIDQRSMFNQQNVASITPPQDNVIVATKPCMADTINNCDKFSTSTSGKSLSADTADMSESSSSAVDWEAVHQSYVNRQLFQSSSNDHFGGNNNVNIDVNENDYFGSQSSVFKLYEDNHPIGQSVQLMETSALPDDLTEAGFDEESIAHLANNIPHNETIYGNTNLRHQVTDVRPVKLAKEIKNQNIQNHVPQSGSDITLLDMSSISQLKKMWSTSDSCANKLKKVNRSYKTQSNEETISKKQNCQKQRKGNTINKTKSKINGNKSTYMNSKKLTVKFKTVQGQTCSGMKLSALKKTRNLPDKLSIHTKPCSVQLTRIEAVDLTLIPNLKIDLTVPNAVSEKYVKERKKVAVKGKKKVRTIHKSFPDNVHEKKVKVIKSKLCSKVHVNKVKASVNSSVSKIPDVVHDHINMLDTTIDQNKKESVDCRNKQTTNVPCNMCNEDDDACSLGEFEIAETGDSDIDYFPSDDECNSSRKVDAKFIKQKSKKSVKSKKHCDKDYKSFRPLTKVKKKNYPKKGTCRIGAPPTKGYFECKHCDFVADEKNLVEKHHRSVHLQHWKDCSYCDFRSRSEDVLLEHTAKHHTHNKPFKCDFQECDYASNNRTDLARHQSKHATTKDYCCELCPYKTKWRRNLRGHKTLVHTTERPFSCDVCGGRFKRKTDLSDHMYRHSDDKPIQCTVCAFRCKTNFELSCHMTTHSDDRPFKCTFPGCDNARKTKSDLTKHMKIHCTTFDHVCPICSRAFKTKQNLRKHHNYMHQTNPGVKPFKCDICQRSYKARNALGKHLKLHAGIYPFTCEVCDHRFSTKTNLQTHSVVHESDRPFLCPVCPYRYKDPGSLLSHIGYFHGDSYAYFCEICKKPWKRYSQLQIHYKRMHTKKELEHVGNRKQVDLALLKMEMKLELEQAELEYTEKRPRGRPKKKKKTKKGNEQQLFDDVDIKQEPVDDYEASPVIANVSSGKEQSKKIRDVRLNEATGEIEVVSDEGVVVSTLISTRNTDLLNEEQKIADHTNHQHCDDNGIDVNPNDTPDDILKEVSQNSVVNVDMFLSATEDSNSDTIIVIDGNDEASTNAVTESADLGVNMTGSEINNIRESTESDIHNIMKANQKSEEGIKNLVFTKIEKPKATLAVYDNFRLPLATKGFQFNYDKNGKKPRSWFMDPDNMHGNFKEKMKKYLRSVGKLPPLPRGRPGPRGPYSKRNLTAFIESRKRKLSENISNNSQTKKFKNNQFQLNELNVHDVGEIEQRHSVPRATRYRGNYSEPQDIQLFETVAGEDLSYMQVIERLPTKPTAKDKPVSKSQSSKVSTLKQKCMPASAEKTAVKKPALKRPVKTITRNQKPNRSKVKSSQITEKNVHLKNRIKITPLKKSKPSKKIPDIQHVNAKKRANNNTQKFHEQTITQKDTSFSERNSFETLQQIVSEYLNQPDDSSHNSVKEAVNSEIVQKKRKITKSKTSNIQKDTVIDTKDGHVNKSTKCVKQKNSSSKVKVSKQRKTGAKKGNLNGTKQVRSKLKVKITKVASLARKEIPRNSQTDGDALPQDLNPKLDITNMTVDNTIHFPQENNTILMVYPPANIPVVEYRRPNAGNDSIQPTVYGDIHMQIPSTMLGLPQTHSNSIFMPCEPNVSNQPPSSHVHPVLLTHTPTVIQDFSCDENSMDPCRPDFEENSKFRLSESKEYMAHYSAVQGNIDDEDDVDLVDTSNVSDDRSLMKEEYMVMVKKENSSERDII